MSAVGCGCTDADADVTDVWREGGRRRRESRRQTEAAPSRAADARDCVGPDESRAAQSAERREWRTIIGAMLGAACGVTSGVTAVRGRHA